MKVYRQGDVLVKQVAKIPKGSKKVDPTKDNKVILAYGEATGHHHRFMADVAVEYAIDNRRFLELSPGAILTHEEHSAIVFPPGYYEIIQQREYSPEAIRNVVD